MDYASGKGCFSCCGIRTASKCKKSFASGWRHWSENLKSPRTDGPMYNRRLKSSTENGWGSIGYECQSLCLYVGCCCDRRLRWLARRGGMWRISTGLLAWWVLAHYSIISQLESLRRHLAFGTCLSISHQRERIQKTCRITAAPFLWIRQVFWINS